AVPRKCDMGAIGRESSVVLLAFESGERNDTERARWVRPAAPPDSKKECRNCKPGCSHRAVGIYLPPEASCEKPAFRRRGRPRRLSRSRTSAAACIVQDCLYCLEIRGELGHRRVTLLPVLRHRFSHDRREP